LAEHPYLLSDRVREKRPAAAGTAVVDPRYDVAEKILARWTLLIRSA
jgi:hypothetical protein